MDVGAGSPPEAEQRRNSWYSRGIPGAKDCIFRHYIIYRALFSPPGCPAQPVAVTMLWPGAEWASLLPHQGIKGESKGEMGCRSVEACAHRSRHTNTRGRPYTDLGEPILRNTASLTISPGAAFHSVPAFGQQLRAKDGGRCKMLDDDGDFATIRSLPLAALVPTLAALTTQAAGFAVWLSGGERLPK